MHSDVIGDMLRRRSILALLGLVLLALGCSATSPGPRTRTPTAASSRNLDPAPRPGFVINGTCPITGRPVAPHPTKIAHEGRTIGFCSERCVAEWRSLSEPIRDHFVAMTESP